MFWNHEENYKCQSISSLCQTPRELLENSWATENWECWFLVLIKIFLRGATAGEFNLVTEACCLLFAAAWAWYIIVTDLVVGQRNWQSFYKIYPNSFIAWHVTHMFRTMHRIVYNNFIEKFMHNFCHGFLDNLFKS